MEPNNEKHLFQLSVKEFIDLYKETLAKISLDVIIEKLNDDVPEKKNFRDIISAKEVSEMTGLKIQSVYAKVSREEIPVLSRGKPLRFRRSEIEKWLMDGRPTLFQMGGDWKVPLLPNIYKTKKI